ncbi:hypothetical protein SEA_GUYFAGIERI_93 [Rhodococcus phage GuyFagieri]|nr:hypothetical protein SEA_GUYFAGIERI_93 [Rhodococcus phage GuyFagieri]
MAQRTDTDVIVTQYRAEYALPPARATIEFGRVRAWRIAGPWQYRETLTARRRWTVVRDLLTHDGARDITDELRGTADRPGTARGLWLDGIDGDARAVLVPTPADPGAFFPTSRGVVMFCEQTAPVRSVRDPIERVEVGDVIRRAPTGPFFRVESITRQSWGYAVSVAGRRAGESGERWTVPHGEVLERRRNRA